MGHRVSSVHTSAYPSARGQHVAARAANSVAAASAEGTGSLPRRRRWKGVASARARWARPSPRLKKCVVKVDSLLPSCGLFFCWIGWNVDYPLEVAKARCAFCRQIEHIRPSLSAAQVQVVALYTYLYPLFHTPSCHCHTEILRHTTYHLDTWQEPPLSFCMHAQERWRKTLFIFT